MKGKKRKRIGILLMIALVICGFVGCGKEEEEDRDTDVTRIAIDIKPFMPTVGDNEVDMRMFFGPEINEITFPEELLRKKALAADANGDGRLSKEEAKAVTKLSLKKLMDSMDDGEEPWPEYTEEDFSFDFEGIQYFTELTELKVNLLGGEVFVAGYSMEDDIFAITKNFHKVYECSKLKKLSLCEADLVNLSLSAFPDLKRLELSCMYGLESVDVGTHKKLSALWISECTDLEMLDVSGAEKLKTLDIVRNDSLKEIAFGEANQKLETIQFNELPGLMKTEVSCLLHLKSLNLMNVGLTSLDVSKNAELEQLCAEGLHLDTLDLRNNPNIMYLINDKDSFREILLPEENCVDMIRWTNSAVTEFPVMNLNPETLTGIDIQGTAIKELDVSRYPKLEYLYYDEDVTKIKR